MLIPQSTNSDQHQDDTSMLVLKKVFLKYILIGDYLKENFGG